MKNSWLIIGAAVLVIGLVLAIAVLPGSSKSPSQTQQSGEISPHYVYYSDAEYAKAKERGRAVLNFWAGWCPTCLGLDQELKDRSSEIPKDVTLLRVNYDTETSLKQKYNIVFQHTLVQVNKDGSEITKWTGGGIDTVLQRLR